MGVGHCGDSEGEVFDGSRETEVQVESVKKDGAEVCIGATRFLSPAEDRGDNWQVEKLVRDPAGGAAGKGCGARDGQR